MAVVEAHKGMKGLPEGSGLTPGLTVSNRPEVKVEIGTMRIERRLRPRRMMDPVPLQVLSIQQEADVEAWAERVLAELPVPRGTQLGPVYEAIRRVDVPGPLQVDVRDAVFKEMSRS
ncbi:hypothetical protein ISS40_07945 [Candidatus Bathyarchaeota archaeon]|nr:hypothetical protein [Candidatus Bathyarchaeota archaeon]